MPIGYLMTTEDGCTADDCQQPDLIPGVRQELGDCIYIGLVPGAAFTRATRAVTDPATGSGRARLFSVLYEPDDVVYDEWLDEVDFEDGPIEMLAAKAFTPIRELPYRRFFGPSGWRVVSLLDGLDRLSREIGGEGVQRAFEIFRSRFNGSGQEVSKQQAAQKERIGTYVEHLPSVQYDGAQAAFDTAGRLVQEMPYALCADDGEEWLAVAIEYQWATAALALAMADVIPAELLAEVLAPIGAMANASGLVEFSALDQAPASKRRLIIVRDLDLVPMGPYGRLGRN